MEKNFKRTLVTTALPYANGPVHIGHLAGVYVPADIYTRYLRLKGESRRYHAPGCCRPLPQYYQEVIRRFRYFFRYILPDFF